MMMPDANQPALDFLLARRSCPARTLTAPCPDRAALEPILTAAARTPDHGKLEPWRFIVLEGRALGRLAALARARGADLGLDPVQVEKAHGRFARSPLCVCVVSAPVDSAKVPQVEQHLSAGAVCLALLNAALAAGWGANWLTGWAAYDRTFVEQGLGLAPAEDLAGFIHIGTATTVPPDHPRPNLARLVTWVSE